MKCLNPARLTQHSLGKCIYFFLIKFHYWNTLLKLLHYLIIIFFQIFQYFFINIEDKDEILMLFKFSYPNFNLFKLLFIVLVHLLLLLTKPLSTFKSWFLLYPWLSLFYTFQKSKKHFILFIEIYLNFVLRKIQHSTYHELFRIFKY